MKNVYLFQPQYTVEYRKETNYWIPYSAGCLWSYATQYPDIVDNFELKKLYYRRDNILQVVSELENPAICGFSCYLWNEQYCLKLAEEIKKQFPKCLIVFGGPQTSSSMFKYDFIDTLVLAEGEISFVDILRKVLLGQKPDTLYRASRLENLEIPSPYLLGIFDPMIKENPGAVWAMTLETNRGCPYACTFCDWGGVTYSKIKRFNLERVAAELEWAADNRVGYIFCADANFGVFKERDLQIAKMIKEVCERSMIDSLNIQYAKNSTEAIIDIAKEVGQYGRGITVSVQSMNPDTLEAIKRQNLDINNIEKLMYLSEKHQVGAYTELILGLPLETATTWRQGITELLELGQHTNIEVWFTLLLENSELASTESRRKYGIQTIWVKDYMKVHQSHDEIVEYNEIVNGTNTMSTDEMVECYMYAWMIIHFHVSGYTQVIAKYARNVCNISYKDFYDQFYIDLRSNSLFENHYQELRSAVSNYLYTGELPNNLVGGHALHSISYKFMYDNKNLVADQALLTLKSLVGDTDKVDLLQSGFIFDQNHQYPINIQADFNFVTGEKVPTNYIFESRAPNTLVDFYTLRRRGLIKNLLSTI